ncbi:ABC transporter permease [Sinorhizobium meliloti]|uniref:ABC transporter permease n=1 Tax=Rhizobium meliloti TaxID=382 RepID=UPI003F17C544
MTKLDTKVVVLEHGHAIAPLTSSTGRPSSDFAAFCRRQFINYGILPLLLILLILTFAIIEPRFLSYGNVMNVTRQVSYLGIIVVAQMLYLVTANYDLSNGATVALSSIGCAMVMAATASGDPATSIALGCLTALGVSLLIGIVNGVLIAVVKVSSFMVTLGMASAAVGIALLVTGGVPVYGLPPEFSRYFGEYAVLGVPFPAIVFALVVCAAYVLLNWTKIGRHAFAVGGNERAAFQSGVNVRRTLLCMCISGSVLAGLVGLLLTARMSTGEANVGVEFPMQSIIACVIGGIALSGGEGRVSGAVMGALFIVLLSNGMDLIRVQGYVQEILLGCLLVLAIIVDKLRTRVRLRQVAAPQAA